MAIRNDIRPRGFRGSLVYQAGDFQFAQFRQAACAWSGASARRDARRDRMVQALEQAEELLSRAETADALELIQKVKAALAGGAP